MEVKLPPLIFKMVLDISKMKKEKETLSEKRLADPFTGKVMLKEEDVKEFIRLSLEDMRDVSLTRVQTISRFKKRAGEKLK